MTPVKWMALLFGFSVAHVAAADATNDDSQIKLVYTHDKNTKVEKQKVQGESPLIIAVKEEEMDAVQAQFDAGAKIDFQDSQGRTALMWACRKGAVPIAALLIDRGANINLADKHGETALTEAGNVGESALVGLLKLKGAKRTDVHLIPQTEPAAPPAAHAWALGVCATFTQANALNHRVLGGQPEGTGDAMQRLHDDWGISDRASLVKVLDNLHNVGQHTGFEKAGEKLAAISDADFEKLLSSHEQKSMALKSVRDSYLKWKEKSGLAWDLCRSANIVNEGFAAGYLNEADAWNMLMAIATETQNSFSSWQDMSDNFLASRAIWGNERGPRYEAISKLLLNPKEPHSPWTQNPWSTDLTGG